ncbi:MotA/TolQ/ExbB proton channel family protein [Dysgonomonas sp. 216]|uniref:MotA/TolQ/ExbB proton channel family protein n=1 Tax=Dysgonomonas sp. 216 TaxID=2302934 RepID=UPI0013D2995D|nr:MotA/TolQ/ExbB proton channel family protein [Dysgonomonas sp. 216]NDW17945.1 MotA/TolQ/ExbB proton channel family protein [Dysgonomonas sp. 216]
METKPKNQKQKPRSKGVSAMLVIIGCGIIAHLFFYLYCGADFQFNEKGQPIDNNIFGTLYHGGFVIPIVITLLLTVFALSIERLFALNKASGKGNVSKFIMEAKNKLEAKDIAGTRKLCDEQQGTVANILRAGLVRYEDVEKLDVNNDEKAAMIEKEIEEATTLELPYLEQNLSVIATISSLGTLFGLLGTVLGMIKSFGAMANDGAPDSIALSLGISEALMNTAMGIGTGAAAIISYGYFSARVQTITNAIDEVGFAIGQTYSKKH